MTKNGWSFIGHMIIIVWFFSNMYHIWSQYSKESKVKITFYNYICRFHLTELFKISNFVVYIIYINVLQIKPLKNHEIF